MFVSGKPRGNASQLGEYLLAQNSNERVLILDVDGRANADAGYMRQVLHSMELNSELTRSKNSVYHAILRPDPESQKDRAMTMEEWATATQILANGLPYAEQRRLTVLHEKDGYFHAHVVFERYNHERGIMVDYKHNYKAHDKVREKLELEFSHKRTPEKNPNREYHKKTLTHLWNSTKSGDQFLKLAAQNGYKVAKGTDRPFKVIDGNGRSFNLARKLENITTKDIRDKLGGVKLMEEKQAFLQMAAQNKDNKPINTKDMNWKNLLNGSNPSLSEIRARHDAKVEVIKEMAEQRKPITLTKHEAQAQIDVLQTKVDQDMSQALENLYRYEQTSKTFKEDAKQLTEADKQEKLTAQFFENDVTKRQQQERERLAQEMREAMERNRTMGYER